MENDFRKINQSCIVCGSGAADFFARKNNFDLWRCKKCGLIFVFPLPENTDKLYSSDYFFGATGGFGYVNYDEDKSAMSGTFVVYLEKIKKFLNGNKLLDVGAATGYFLQLAKKYGFDACGVEISDHAAGIARQKGLSVSTGTLETRDFPSECFDIITMWDVVEHLSGPILSIRRAHSILKTGGLIAINTPDSSSFAAKILGKHWHLLVPPEHLYYFNSKNLSLLLRKEGFEVVYTDKIGKSFTLQYILKTLARWQRNFIWRGLAEFSRNTFIGNLTVPINLRDNFFIIARKNG